MSLQALIYLEYSDSLHVRESQVQCWLHKYLHHPFLQLHPLHHWHRRPWDLPHCRHMHLCRTTAQRSISCYSVAMNRLGTIRYKMV